MSQYLDFFVRHDNGNFVPIASYSRGTKVYEEVNVPYGRICKLNKQELNDVAVRLRAGKNFAKSQIKAIDIRLDLLIKANNSLEEKDSVMSEYLNLREEYEEEIQTLERFAIEIDFIAEMTYDDNEIYAGIEVCNPTEQDICSG